MRGRISSPAMTGLAAWLVLLTMLGPTALFAGTTGKLAGRLVDGKKQPLDFATVFLVGTKLGAFTDADGRYSVLNIPAGTYEVQFSRLGYESKRVKNVVVSSDQTTSLDATIREAAITAEEVIVTADRPPVEIEATSTRQTVTSEEIESLPVQNLEDVVNLQAGVVDGHFRGGRQAEVQYQVDGVSVNNAFDNKPMFNLDRSLLQEVQVISGTFDAEYGQAMSGVVNAVLKQGTPDLRWSAEIFSGGFFFPGKTSRLTDDTFRPTGIQNYQMTVSGPLPLPSTVFLVSGRRYDFDDFVRGERTFAPTDTNDVERGIFYPTGDGKNVALGYTREWSGVAKLTNTHFENDMLHYQATASYIEGRRANYAYHLNPDGLTRQKTFTIAHGPDWTHTFDATTYLNVNLRQNFRDYSDYAYADLYDPRYDAAGPAEGSPNYERNTVIIEGVDLGRYVQKTNAFMAKAALTSQVTPEHLVKVGGEFELPGIKFGSPGFLTFRTNDNGVQELGRREGEPPDYPAPRTYYPIMGAAFVQDQYERKDGSLTVRAGLRYDYMDSRAMIPGDLANPANAIAGVDPVDPVPTTPKVAISPRLGVAYPIEDKAAVHFAYGHFRQFPSINDMFSNADYSVLYNLQAGIIPGTLGNPDVKPERTIQYEIGYKHALTEDFGADLTFFYKDIRDLLGVEFISTYNDAEYPRLTNVDFGNVLGITLALDHRRIGPASVALDYTWQQAMGNSSDPRETATRRASGEDPQPRLTAFDWDQKHTLNMTLALNKPNDYTVSAVLRVASGRPYTPELDAAFGFGLGDNAGRKPSSMVLDLRAEKDLGRVARGLVCFARVFNAFDTLYFNGSVFASTGSPYYSRFPNDNYAELRNPGRFYTPRRIELGVRFGLGGGAE